ncbi:MAG: hypothetical protein ACFFDY_01050 [Candidatus Thorarchaeota archaeon]
MFEIFTWKTAKFKRSTQPQITLNSWQIKFNHEFVKLLEKEGLNWSSYISCFIDEKNYRLGFLFHDEHDMEHKFKITRQNNTFSISAYSLNKKYPWINKISKNPDIKKRRFKPKKEASFWFITLDRDAYTNDTSN